MNWKNFWNERGASADPLAQVARVGGKGHDEKIMDRIVEHIVQVLAIQKTDTVLDMCCGNGLLTARLAPYCKKIIGADFSEVLIAQAKKQNPQIEFVCVDATKPDSLLQTHATSFDKINLYFSFQYFETVEMGAAVVNGLVKLAGKGSAILLGDIPDREHFFVYYHSAGRMLRLIKQMLTGRNDMGKFWSEEELKLITERAGASGKKLKQPTALPYSHYRMDWLISVAGGNQVT